MALTWKNVDVPAGGGAIGGMSGVMGGFNDALQGIRNIGVNNQKRAADAATASALASLAGITDMEGYRGAIGNLDFSKLNPDAISTIMGMPTEFARRDAAIAQAENSKMSAARTQQDMSLTAAKASAERLAQEGRNAAGALQDELFAAVNAGDQAEINRLGDAMTGLNPGMEYADTMTKNFNAKKSQIEAESAALGLTKEQRAYDKELLNEEAKINAGNLYLNAQRNFESSEAMKDYYVNSNEGNRIRTESPELWESLIAEIDNEENKSSFGTLPEDVSLIETPELNALMQDAEFRTATISNEMADTNGARLDARIEEISGLSSAEDGAEGKLFDIRDFMINQVDVGDEFVFKPILDEMIGEIKSDKSLKGVDDKAIAAALSMSFDNVGGLRALLTRARRNDRTVSGSSAKEAIEILKSKFNPERMREEMGFQNEQKGIAQTLSKAAQDVEKARIYEARTRGDGMLNLVARSEVESAIDNLRAVNKAAYDNSPEGRAWLASLKPFGPDKSLFDESNQKKSEEISRIEKRIATLMGSEEERLAGGLGNSKSTLAEIGRLNDRLIELQK